MARHRNIEEEFRAIAPRGYRGIPSAQPIAVGVTGSGGADSTASMSQASQEISQLESQFKQQANLIQANTQALQESTVAHTGASIGSSLGGVASGLLGGGLGLLSPIVSGIMSLFGAGQKAAPTPLPLYTPPPSVQMSDTLRSATPNPTSASSASPAAGSGGGGAAASTAPQITVNVSAMDSQSFMDRSSDIASAVREAMLNLHPINDVVASL
jgi:hypothetical protein